MKYEVEKSGFEVIRLIQLSLDLTFLKISGSLKLKIMYN